MHPTRQRLRPTNPTRILTGQISAIAAILALPALGFAQTPEQRLARPAVEEVAPVVLPEVVVTGEGNGVAAELQVVRETYAGSAATVPPKELELQKSNNLGDVISRVPGAAYIDEDGRGTKPNIGLRGLPVVRSEFVQLLLDGVPVQPSLYSETAAYFAPPVERIRGIEVFKGGSAILFGPNSMGGVVNMLSRSLSTRPFEAILDTRFDSFGDYSANLFLSGTHGPVAFGVDYMRKGGDGFRDSLGYNIQDLDVRLALQINENNSAQIRFMYYEEQSETPGALLPEQFRENPTGSNKPNDEFFGKRIAGDIRTSHQLTERQRLDLLFYTFSFQRDWFLQDFVRPDSTDLTLADKNQQYLRDFTTVGFEPRYTLSYDLGDTKDHELVIGGRIYYDTVNRQTAVGKHGDSRYGNGVLASEDELTTLALALYVQNEFKLTDRLSVIPGLRYEHIEQTREDVFNQLPEESMDYNVWVPGLGIKYELAPKTLAYANISKSFRPPSFADSFNPAIGASSADLRPTTSLTYEAGIRANPYPWLLVDAGVFYTKFKDQVVVSGATAANFDTRTYGLEATFELGLVGLTHAIQTGDRNYSGDHEVFVIGGATVLESQFVDGFFDGNDIPYVPKQTYLFGLRYEYQDRFALVFQGRYVSERFSDNANTEKENASGTIGELADYTVFDIKARWRVSENLALNAGVLNLGDEIYGTQRRTSQQGGIFPGPVRSVYVGATFTF